MKRFCVMLAQTRQGDAYLDAIKCAWEACGVEFFRIDLNTDADEEVSANPTDDVFPADLAAAIDYAVSEEYDELIVMTDELMGPLFPLSDLIARAEQCRAHAWALTKGAPMWGLRGKVLGWRPRTAQEIEDCCQELQVPSLYDVSDMADLTKVPLLDEPLVLAKERHCPFFLHEVFHRDYSDVITTTLGHQGQQFYRWLQHESGWDVNLLWDYLLPNCHQEDYYENMHLNYVLPVEGQDVAWVEKELPMHSIALVMHLYYTDKLAESCSFATRFPPQTHVIITTNDERKKRIIEKFFSNTDFVSLEVRVIQNRGRDVSSLLVGAVDVFDQYEFVCFFHDKKTTQTKPGSIGAGFAYRLEENLFASRNYIYHVLRLFCDNPRLGLLSPPPPHHGPYFFTLGTNWGPNYDNTERFCKYMEFRAPISEDKMPIAPLGTCFWFRGKALKTLADYCWRYEDFPPEPNKSDGTILHAIERAYAYACVDAGYYPAFVMSSRYAGIEYSSMRHYVRVFNGICEENGIRSYQRNMSAELKKRLEN